MSRRDRRGKTGCVVAIGVLAALVIVCGGLVTCAGYSISQSPLVQRAIEVGGAVMDVTQEAMRAPGAREMRSAGCMQAMVLTPELVERLFVAMAPDGGAAEARATATIPLAFCAVRRGAPTVPTCEHTARAYASGLETPPSEVAVRVIMQGDSTARCEGVHAADGTFVRAFDEDLARLYGLVGPPESSLTTP
jgi:hypothetical protein